jgi:hypothetical protein
MVTTIGVSEETKELFDKIKLKYENKFGKSISSNDFLKSVLEVFAFDF